MMFKKVIAFLAVVAVSAMIMTGCGKSDKSKTLEDVEIANFIQPVVGEEIAVITVKDFGEIKVKLFPEYAPKGVENFIGLSEQKYYDELIFHRVEKDFCIQGGDPKGDGTGGKSMWGEDFDLEPSDNLRNFTGAVAYAHAQGGTNGSQFYIVNAPAEQVTDEVFANYAKQGYAFPENVKEKYKEVGGAPSLDGGYTVFGQVFDGMDVVQKINEVEVRNDGSASSSKPINQVMIEKVEIVKYKG